MILGRLVGQVEGRARIWTALLVCLGFVATPVGVAAQTIDPVIVERLGLPANAPEARIVRIPLSKADLVELPEAVRDVIVADPEIADIIVKTPRQVYLVGRSVGDTNVFFVGEGGAIVEHVLVRVEVDVEAAEEAIAELMPEARIKLKAVGTSIVIQGTVNSAREATDAAAIAARFVEEETDVVNMLRILADQQVLLQVRVAEMQRNVVKNMSAITNFNRRLLGTANNQARGLQFTTSGVAAFDKGTEGSITFNFLGLNTTAFTALERQGLIKTLAEPALTAISGETANFLAGGQFPVPAGVDSNGNLIIEFRDFGVSLSFTPIVLAEDQISLRIKTEVSRKADENKLILTVGGSQIEAIGLTVNRADSTVNLPSGGSLMIAGLLQNDEFNTVEGFPWVKDVPVLGALFRSPAFEKNETELIILVKAFLVHPVEKGPRLTLPTDGFVTASDFDLYLLGRLNKRYAKTSRPNEIPAIRGPFGYIME